jgi:hypothetical protein
LTLRADRLYWLVYLAEQGIAAKKAEFKADKAVRPAEAAASLASWQLDLEQLVNKVRLVITPPVRKPKK